MKKPTKQNYDVAIIGAGIIGASTLYALSQYSDVENIALIDKRKQVGEGVSHRSWNSQTLHFGDIETNYTPEKAKKVKGEASLLAGYLQDHENERLYQSIHKMVLAVGEDEAEELAERYENIKDIFPNLEKLDRDEIKEVEPNLTKGRDPDTELLALYNPKGHTVDYGNTAKSFVREARLSDDTRIDLYMNEKVSDIEKLDSGYRLEAEKTTIKADVPVMAVGAASLQFAHQMEYKNHWILLPVAGNFVCAPRLVNGKVYMMQLDEIPFAAVHADPQVDNLNETQFGPVAKILPMLERGNYSTVSDFFDLAKPRFDAFASLLSIGLQPVYLQYMLQQILYDIPYIGRWGFLQQARKIIPTLSYSDLEEKKRHGGIRPQIIDTKQRALKMGEAKIVGDDIIFDITPSPGASVSLANAKKNAKQITDFFGSSVDFNENEFMADHEYDN